MKTIDRILTVSIMSIGALMLGLMVIQITIDVILRTGFGTSFPGTVEIVTNYYMVALSFLPIILAERHGRQIAAGFLFDTLPRPIQWFAVILAKGLTAVIFGLLAWRSFIEAMNKTEIGAFAVSGTDRIAIWPCYWILPLAFGLCAIAALLPRTTSSNSLNVEV